MDKDLTSWVSERLERDETLSDDAKLWILAALDGEAALADMADYTPPAPATETPDDAEPAGAFVKQIKVRGFRGIGPEAQLDLDPFPSLTVISGRNGSGKSSFAEALEVALTGTSHRWKARAKQWKDHWRNVHDGQSTRIQVTLAEEGIGLTGLTAEWSPEADLDDAAMSLQRHGEKKQAGTASLGWSGPLETYRPLLTYEELGSLLTAEPKVLYDALSTVLGLEKLTAAVKSLDEHQKALNQPDRDLKARKKDLQQALAALNDERATRALSLLKARIPDVDALRQLATGTSDDTAVGTRVRSLLVLNLPGPDACREAANELTAASDQLAEVADRIGEALQLRSQLLTAAVAVHEHLGDQSCPVCDGGTLDAARVAVLREELDREQQELAELQAARTCRNQALSAGRSLIGPAPAVLDQEFPTMLAEPVETLRTVWSAWSTSPAEGSELARHLLNAGEPVRAALDEVRSAASTYLEGLDEAWSRIAAPLAGYATDAESWHGQKEAAAEARAAHKWLKDNEIVLKNERVKPIAEEAKRIWAGLRQESNVEIAGLTLESANTRRHVAISAQVDGQDAGALAVMSQGELHSLALALFLPRATMPASPFRFVLLDDPVQAMDPSKVDGLVNVLLELARTRQVIVFSHDDRFASAVRRAPRTVPIKILDVKREANSRVTPVVTYNRADRYLKDAFALLKDDGLPEETLHRVLPGLLRMALEAEAREVFFGRALASGTPHGEVEEEWSTRHTTRERLALTLEDEHRIDAWLDKRSYRRWALRKSNSVHYKLEHGDPKGACRDVENTLRDLRQGAK